MNTLTDFFNYIVDHPLSSLFFLIVWQIIVFVIFELFSAKNTPLTNGIISAMIIFGGGLVGLITKPTKILKKHSIEHLNKPLFIISRNIGLIIFLGLLAFIGSSALLHTATFLQVIVENGFMFGLAGLFLIVLFWSAIGLFIGDL
jgi:hypothetical protein